MSKFRVIKKDNKYYVQKLRGMLFWKHWCFLDAYGRDEWNFYYTYPMELSSEWLALDAMKRCAEPDNSNNHNDYQVIKEI